MQLKRHTQLVLQVEYYEFPILPIRLAYVISKTANFYVCCDKQQ